MVFCYTIFIEVELAVFFKKKFALCELFYILTLFFYKNSYKYIVKIFDLKS